MKRMTAGQRDRVRSLHQGIADRAGAKVSGGVYKGAPAAGSPMAKKASAQRKAGLTKPRAAKAAGGRGKAAVKPRKSTLSQPRMKPLGGKMRRQSTQMSNRRKR